MNDSWSTFDSMLREESAAMRALNAAARQVTQALIDGGPEAIAQCDRDLNAVRSQYQSACSKRRGMQVRGFGAMSLRQVCSYAPSHMRPQLNQRLAELTYGAISLGITLKNNKSLILGGLDRLVRITSKLQETMTERTGVYKRRGYVAPPGASVIVSSKA